MTHTISVDSEAKLCHLGLLYSVLFRWQRELTLRNLVQEALHPAKVN